MNKYLIKIFLDHLAFGLIVPIAVIWQLSRGLNLFQIGILLSVNTVIMLITDIPLGIFADKYGRKISLYFGTVLLGFSFIILSQGESFISFLIYAIINAIGWSFISGTEEAYLFEFSESNKKSYRNILSNVYITDESATILGLISSSLMASSFGIQKSILLAGLILFASSILTLFIVKNSKKINDIKQAQNTNILIDAINIIKERKSIVLIMLLFAIFYEGGRLLWQPQLIQHGLKIEYIGYIYALFKVFSILGSLCAKKIYIEHNLENKLFVSGILLTISFLLISHNYISVILIGFCAYSFIENYSRIIQSEYLNKLIIKNRSTILSVNSLLRNGFSSAITPLLGLLAINSTYKGFYALAAIQIAATIILYRFFKKSKKEQRK